MADKTHLSEQEAQAVYDSMVAHMSERAAKISELCKYVWVGSLAIFYALVTAPTEKFTNHQRSLLFIAASAGALAFLFDYLQNLSAYLHARFFADWLKSSEGPI